MLFRSLFLLFGPAHRSAQAGFQAGLVSEAAGLRAGPDRGQAGQGPEDAGLLAGLGRAPELCPCLQSYEIASLLSLRKLEKHI